MTQYTTLSFLGDTVEITFPHPFDAITGRNGSTHKPDLTKIVGTVIDKRESYINKSRTTLFSVRVESYTDRNGIPSKAPATVVKIVDKAHQPVAMQKIEDSSVLIGCQMHSVRK